MNTDKKKIEKMNSELIFGKRGESGYEEATYPMAVMFVKINEIIDRLNKTPIVIEGEPIDGTKSGTSGTQG